MGKVLVFGVDALSPVLVERWTAGGLLPNFSRLRESGQWGALRSTGEFSSPQAWPSFMTGVNPGRHGIFSFIQHVPGTYDVEHVTSRNLQAPTIFQLLSEAGARVAALNVPCTYPLAPLNGVGIADWLCPSINSPGSTYPAELAGKLHAKYGEYPFHVDVKRHARAGRYDRALTNALEGIRVKDEAARDLYAQGPWDLFALAFVETDAIQHYFWHFSDPTHPLYAQMDRARWGEPILIVYQAIDKLLGEWLERVDEDTTVLVMSDHGGAIFNRGQTYMPALLRELGLLVEKRKRGGLGRPMRRGLQSVGEMLHGSMPKQMKMRLYHHPWTQRLVERFFARSFTANNDWTKTRAYSYYWDTAPWINVIGREPAGIVAPGAEYETVRETILTALRSATDEATGQPAIERAYRREEVYAGPCLEYMPDIGIWWNRAIPLEGPLRLGNGTRISEQGMDVSGITGGHDPLGSVGLHGPGVPGGLPIASQPASQIVDAGSSVSLTVSVIGLPPLSYQWAFEGLPIAGAKIEDLAPTILTLLGQPVPRHMEGESLVEGESRVEGGGSRVAEKAGEICEPVTTAHPYSASEESIVEERLRNLGYM